MDAQVIHDGRHYRAVHQRVSDDPLTVVYFESWLPDPSREDPPAAQRFFVRRGINFIGIRPARNDWYQADEILGVAAAVRCAVPNGRLAGYGGSMGGFAAINFAPEFGFATLLAICPQFSIAPEKAPWETRWLREARGIAFRHDRIDRIPRLRHGHVMFDPLTEDRRHAEAILAHHDLAPLPVRFTGHEQVRILQRTGLAPAIIIGLLRGDIGAAEAMRLIRAGRSRSNIAWLEGAKALLRRGAVASAARAMDRADAARLPDRLDAVLTRVEILRRQDREAEAARHLATFLADPATPALHRSLVAPLAQSLGPAAAGRIEGYADWAATHDTPTEADGASIAAAAQALPARPSVAVVLVLDRAEQGAAADTVACVRAQLYPWWELWIAGEAGSEAAGFAALAARDRRIRCLPGPFAEAAEAMNAALHATEAPFLAVLHPGDRLALGALHEVAGALATPPEAGLVYTDEDVTDWLGRRSAPRFKPGWDPDRALAEDYVGGLAVWRTAAVRAVGGWRAGFGRAAGYDLLLRATAALLPDRIRHVPAVLLHRPAALAAPDPAAARRAVRGVLGGDVRVEPAPLRPAAQRVVWPVPDPPPRVSVIVSPGADGPLPEEGLRALLACGGHAPVEVLSAGGGAGKAAAINRAAGQATGDILLLLDADVVAAGAGWLREMAGHALRPDVGAVGASLRAADGTLLHGGMQFGPGRGVVPLLRGAAAHEPGADGALAVCRSVLAVSGACMALRRAVFHEAAGLNADRFAAACHDLDLCLRLGELGYRIVWTPFAELTCAAATAPALPDGTFESRGAENLWHSWRHIFGADPFGNDNPGRDPAGGSLLRAPRRRAPWHVEP